MGGRKFGDGVEKEEGRDELFDGEGSVGGGRSAGDLVAGMTTQSDALQCRRRGGVGVRSNFGSLCVGVNDGLCAAGGQTLRLLAEKRWTSRRSRPYKNIAKVGAGSKKVDEQRQRRPNNTVRKRKTARVQASGDGRPYRRWIGANRAVAAVDEDAEEEVS